MTAGIPDLATAFAVQACSDFEARDRLIEADLPECHQLHYLQMASEKVAKAHYLARGDNPDALQTSHAYIAKAVPIIVRDTLGRTEGAKPAWILNAVRELARQIELLAPSVDASGTVPANCEYPWQDAQGRVHAPCRHSFAINLNQPAAIKMLKALRTRAAEIAGLKPPTEKA